MVFSINLVYPTRSLDVVLFSVSLGYVLFTSSHTSDLLCTKWSIYLKSSLHNHCFIIVEIPSSEVGFGTSLVDNFIFHCYRLLGPGKNSIEVLPLLLEIQF